MVAGSMQIVFKKIPRLGDFLMGVQKTQPLISQANKFTVEKCENQFNI